MRTYAVNEVFYSLQGEGVRAGTANIFLRFSGCNLACAMQAGPKSPGGWVCDTDFAAHIPMTAEAIVLALQQASPKCGWVILTGGEPGLQVDRALIDYLHKCRYLIAIETNGTVALPDGIDWVCVSPKVGPIKQTEAHEVKRVLAAGEPLGPDGWANIKAKHRLVSPAHGADGKPLPGALEWCIEVVKENPRWRLSVQQHKGWRVR